VVAASREISGEHLNKEACVFPMTSPSPAWPTLLDERIFPGMDNDYNPCDSFVIVTNARQIEEFRIAFLAEG
jgi:hypothetical protein